jgi:hypothetical protein
MFDALLASFEWTRPGRRESSCEDSSACYNVAVMTDDDVYSEVAIARD